ncbi:SRA stem-loop-interacting RNA-binding protein, mitochondrial-like [Anoplophora glabripennis]|uniref:SRA stem-loop-interacting RNA-binding protein, mitochondrial-like n=1 Tax=Anoplophora glabripennis TaxID=217634 RepID=UPI000874E088|nr:SRA stem-loop-interacting RNA-binding protein, mitochondrial-like [Anoplophora glabripennis]
MAGNAVRSLYRLYVGNLPWTVGHNELKKYFSKFGHVNGATVVFDKKTGLSKYYGFVTFSHRDGFENATFQSAHKLEGNSLKVENTNS